MHTLTNERPFSSLRSQTVWPQGAFKDEVLKAKKGAEEHVKVLYR